MKQNLSPKVVGIIIAVVVVLVGLIGFKSLSHSRAGAKVSNAEMEQHMRATMSSGMPPGSFGNAKPGSSGGGNFGGSGGGGSFGGPGSSGGAPNSGQ